MREYPAYRISMYPGCEKARIQTCENATRRLCSYVSALAAYERTGEISGTLTKAPEGRIEFWISCMLLEFGITIEHLALWVRSINGSPFTRELPETALGLTPDPYQISAMRGMTEAGGCIGGFMGSGKTLMGTMLAMAESVGGNERCWIFGPLNSFPAWERVRDQELNKYFKEVKILSIDSAHKYTGVSHGDVLIVDECFPGDTLVATQAGDIRICDLVDMPEAPLVWSAENGLPVLRRITGSIQRTSPTLLEIHHAFGTLLCTPNHPLYVLGKGWARADTVVCDDSLYILPQSFRDASGWEEPLLLDILHHVHPSPRGLRTDEDKEPRQSPSSPRGDQQAPQREAFRGGARRQRARLPQRGSSSLRSSFPLPSGCDPHETVLSLSDGIQGGLRRSPDEDSHRGRWRLSPLDTTTGTGRQEGCPLVLSRVARVEVHEQGGRGTSGRGRCTDTKVYCLAVDGTHNFFANGVLVHNCHRAGGAEARRTKSIHTIRSKFRFGLGLSGTFVHSGVEKVASVKDVAVPGLAMFASKWEMGAAFNCMAKKNVGSRNVMALERPTGAAKERFMQWLEHGIYLIRPEAEDVRQAFTLPGQTTQQVSFLSPWSSLVDSVARGAHAILAETGELPHAQAVAHWLGREGAEEKVDWVLGELRELPDGTQLAIAANYTNTLDLLEAALKEEGYTYVRVDGAVVGADRSAAERNFQQGHAQVFIGQIHAASESMNLQCANISLTLDVSTSAVDYSQWLCRTHRRGQTTHCVHVDLVANKYQNHVLERLRLGQDFASDCAEYAELRRTVSTFNIGSGESHA